MESGSASGSSSLRRSSSNLSNLHASLSHLIRDTHRNLAAGLNSATEAWTSQTNANNASRENGLNGAMQMLQMQVQKQQGGRGGQQNPHQDEKEAFSMFPDDDVSIHTAGPASRRMNVPASPAFRSMDRSSSPPPSMDPFTGSYGLIASPPNGAQAIHALPSPPQAAAPASSHSHSTPFHGSLAHIADAVAQATQSSHEAMGQVSAMHTTLAAFKTKLRSAFDANMLTMDNKGKSHDFNVGLKRM